MVETPRQAERVLFLRGASGDREFWKPVADRVQHSGDKVLLGWPGFGSNPADPSITSLDDLFQSVLLLIDRPVDLVAQSMVSSPSVPRSKRPGWFDTSSSRRRRAGST